MLPEELQAAVRFLDETPDIISRKTGGLSTPSLKWKPGADQFSFLEHVCHLRDLEREGYGVRIHRLLTEYEPSLKNFDGAQVARERDYQSEDFQTAFSAFERARKENLEILRGLDTGQLDLSGQFESAGRVTLRQIVLMMQAHDGEHREALEHLSEQLPNE